MDHINDAQVNNKEGNGGNILRKQFLSKLNFKWDSFIVPVTEQEFFYANTTNPDTLTSPNFAASNLAYFVPPNSSTQGRRPMLHTLHKRQSTFVYGRPGDGKTSLRLAFEAQCRNMKDPSMTVFYELGRELDNEDAVTAHWQRISRQFAIDLFIQVLERYQPEFDDVSNSQIHALGMQLYYGGRPLRRLAQRITEELEPVEALGLSALWPSVGRIGVRYLGQSTGLVDLLHKAVASSVEMSKQGEPPLAAYWQNLQAQIEAARLWGFDNIYILVDGVDNWQRESDEMLQLIMPLLQHVPIFMKDNVYFKFFLPVTQNFPELVANFWQGDEAVSVPADSLTLSWDVQSLKVVLERRFKVVGSRRKGFNDFADNTFEQPLDDLLLQEADGSPRQLLNLASALINEMALMNKDLPDDQLPSITPQTWQQVKSSI